MSAPGYLAYWVMADSLAMIAATLFALSRALRGPDWPSDRRASILQASAILLVGWFAAAVLLAWIGVYDGGPDRLPTIQFGILIPNAIGGFLGLGTRHHTIPWGKLEYDTTLGGYRTDITEEQVRGAPSFPGTAADWPDRDREREVHDHWNARYYWAGWV